MQKDKQNRESENKRNLIRFYVALHKTGTGRKRDVSSSLAECLTCAMNVTE